MGSDSGSVASVLGEGGVNSDAASPSNSSLKSSKKSSSSSDVPPLKHQRRRKHQHQQPGSTSSRMHSLGMHLEEHLLEANSEEMWSKWEEARDDYAARATKKRSSNVGATPTLKRQKPLLRQLLAQMPPRVAALFSHAALPWPTLPREAACQFALSRQSVLAVAPKKCNSPPNPEQLRQ